METEAVRDATRHPEMSTFHHENFESGKLYQPHLRAASNDISERTLDYKDYEQVKCSQYLLILKRSYCNTVFYYLLLCDVHF